MMKIYYGPMLLFMCVRSINRGGGQPNAHYPDGRFHPPPAWNGQSNVNASQAREVGGQPNGHSPSRITNRRTPPRSAMPLNRTVEISQSTTTRHKPHEVWCYFGGQFDSVSEAIQSIESIPSGSTLSPLVKLSVFRLLQHLR